MKRDTHPDYQEVVFIDRSTGDKFLTRSTMKPNESTTYEGKEYPAYTVDISSASHPFYTGNHREVDTAGRIEKFRQRYGKGAKA